MTPATSLRDKLASTVTNLATLKETYAHLWNNITNEASEKGQTEGTSQKTSSIVNIEHYEDDFVENKLDDKAWLRSALRDAKDEIVHLRFREHEFKSLHGEIIKSLSTAIGEHKQAESALSTMISVVNDLREERTRLQQTVVHIRRQSGTDTPRPFSSPVSTSSSRQRDSPVTLISNDRDANKSASSSTYRSPSPSPTQMGTFGVSSRGMTPSRNTNPHSRRRSTYGSDFKNTNDARTHGTIKRLRNKLKELEAHCQTCEEKLEHSTAVKDQIESELFQAREAASRSAVEFEEEHRRADAKMKKIIQDLQDKDSENQSLITAYEKTIAQLKEKLIEWKEHCAKRERTMQKRNDDVDERASIFQTKNEKLRRRIALFEKQITGYRSKVIDMERTMEKDRNVLLSALRKTKFDAKELTQRYKDLELECESMRNESIEQRESLHSVGEEMHILRNEMNNLSTNLSEKEDECNRTKKLLEEKTTMTEKLEKSNADLNVSLSRSQRQHQMDRMELEDSLRSKELEFNLSLQKTESKRKVSSNELSRVLERSEEMKKSFEVSLQRTEEDHQRQLKAMKENFKQRLHDKDTELQSISNASFTLSLSEKNLSEDLEKERLHRTSLEETNAQLKEQLEKLLLRVSALDKVANQMNSTNELHTNERTPKDKTKSESKDNSAMPVLARVMQFSPSMHSNSSALLSPMKTSREEALERENNALRKKNKAILHRLSQLDRIAKKLQRRYGQDIFTLLASPNVSKGKLSSPFVAQRSSPSLTSSSSSLVSPVAKHTDA